jgi:hypothetical protein
VSILQTALQELLERIVQAFQIISNIVKRAAKTVSDIIHHLS